MTSPASAIDELVLPLVTAAGLELWDVEVNPRTVRVLVDRPGGVDLEAVAALARAVSAALDGRDDLTPSNAYQLEVSSPGVERTLRTVTHFRRFVGATVAVKTSVAVGGTRRLQGVLRTVDEAGISIDGDGGTTSITYQQMQRARTVLIWGSKAKGPDRPKARAASDAHLGSSTTAADRPRSVKDVVG